MKDRATQYDKGLTKTKSLSYSSPGNTLNNSIGIKANTQNKTGVNAA